jgi:hypothetical protein
MSGAVKVRCAFVIYCFPDPSEQTQYRRLSVLFHVHDLSYSYILQVQCTKYINEQAMGR